MTVDFWYSLMQYIFAKNTSQGYLSPQDFYLCINQAQYSYMDYLLGEYQKYQPTRPISVVQFGNNERVRQSIAPLIYSELLTISPTGVSPFPVYFEYTDDMWSAYGLYNIRFSQQPQLDSMVHSVIDPIEQNPVYVLNTDGFQFYPNNLGMARLSYVKRPPSIIWGYDLDSNGEPIYNPFTSQQPVWSVSDMYNIIVRALQIVGLNLQVGSVIEYANVIKNQGQ